MYRRCSAPQVRGAPCPRTYNNTKSKHGMEGRGGGGRGPRSRTPGGREGGRGTATPRKRPASRGPSAGEAVPPAGRGRGGRGPPAAAAAAPPPAKSGKGQGKGKGKGKDFEAVPKFAPGPRAPGRRSGEAVPPGDSGEAVPPGKFAILPDGVCVRTRWPGTIARTFPPAGEPGSWTEVVEQAQAMGCSKVMLRTRGKASTLLVVGPQAVAQSAYMQVRAGARRLLGRRGVPAMRILHVYEVSAEGVGAPVVEPTDSSGESTVTCVYDVDDEEEEEKSPEAVPGDDSTGDAPPAASASSAGEAVPPAAAPAPAPKRQSRWHWHAADVDVQFSTAAAEAEAGAETAPLYAAYQEAKRRLLAAALDIAETWGPRKDA
jgi:hypothetical protein